MAITGTLLIAIVFFSLIWVFFRDKITSPFTVWPVVRHLPSIVLCPSRVHDYLTFVLSQCEEYTFELKGPVFSNLNFLITSNPDNIHYILSSNFGNFTKGQTYKDIFEVLGEGILVAEGESWKFQRRLIHSLFRHVNFRSLIEKTSHQKLEHGMFQILDQMVQLGLTVDMQDLFQRFTVDVTCKFLLGFDLKSLCSDQPEVRFATAIDHIEEALLYRHLKPMIVWRLQQWLGIGVEGKAKKANATLDEFIYQQISHKRGNVTKRADEEEEDFDMISMFMSAEEEASSKYTHADRKLLSDRFLRDSVLSILTGGRDTTSTALTWCLWLVSTHPSVESVLKKELNEAFDLKQGAKWKFQSFKEVNKLVYLHATICETLRLYPSIPYNHKASVKPDILPSGHRIGKDADVLFSIYAMGRMEKIWGNDCLEFKPERWISEKGEIIHMPSYKFNVFGAGPRTCLGKDLALMELKIVIPALIWNYHFEVVEGHCVVPANSVVLYMKHGLKVYVTKNYH